MIRRDSSHQTQVKRIVSIIVLKIEVVSATFVSPGAQFSHGKSRESHSSDARQKDPYRVSVEISGENVEISQENFS